MVKQFENLGIVENLNAKLRRRVIPTEFGDIPTDMMAFLQRNGISSETVRQALAMRDNAGMT